MFIEGRKEKQYSESLFNQLYLLTLLIQSENDLPERIIENRIKKSGRTISRYFHALHTSGLIPKINHSRKTNIYSISYTIDDMERYYIKWAKEYIVDVKDAMLRYLDSYSKNNFNPKNRLYRLGRILICSFDDCHWDDSISLEDDGSDDIDLSDIDMTDLVLYENNFYRIVFSGYEDLYDGLSVRSKQRDFKLLRDVFVKVLSDFDTFGY